MRELPGSACGREAQCVSRRGFPPVPDSSGTAERFPNSLTLGCHSRGEGRKVLGLCGAPGPTGAEGSLPEELWVV